ncbi:DUF2231 domain-containing protein [Micromonospora purpureochromogenes]|uniref:Membrane protein n=1 Tax=Micromonospora purpureochromogenes TaxID=47872 RepID=A0ABX2RRU6_9ACTN|nr:DUF2231 domain-containing protein [Micromonospora purpureochromogenes]NYF58748.1 putative membrane protein [Micromonospora purpureochromogenes]
MESRLRVQGHPIQPMLVTFPFGLFVSAVLFDLADVAGGPAFLGEVGYWTAVAALVAAALAGVAGMVDLWDVRAGRTRRTMVTFNLVNAGMAALFLLACLIRADAPERGATAVLVITELVALAVGAVGVRLGARLMRQFDAGRREPSGFDALAGVPAAGATVEIIRPRA